MTDQELPTEAEERGALPPGWKWTTIDEVTQPVEKIDPRNEPKNKFIYLDISAIDNTTNIITEPQSFYGSKAPSRARQLVSTDDILFSTVRVYLKNIALVSASYNNAVASTGFSILRMEEGVNPRYLFYYCLTRELLHNIGELQKGISYPAVRDSDVRDQAVPLPPKSEQDRIVAELDTQLSRLEAGIAGLKSAQANVERERAAVLNAACLGQLVPQDSADEPAAPLLRRILAERRTRWEAEQLAQMEAAGRPPKDDQWKQRYVEPAPPETEGLPELPDGWIWVTVDQLASSQPRSIQSGPFGSMLLHSEFQKSGFLVIGIDNVLDTGFSLGVQHRISQENFDRLRKYSVRAR